MPLFTVLLEQMSGAVVTDISKKEEERDRERERVLCQVEESEGEGTFLRWTSS
jgi:hypothetical protein